MAIAYRTLFSECKGTPGPQITGCGRTQEVEAHAYCKNSWCGANTVAELPARPTGGETDETIASQIRLMKDEHRKRGRDQAAIGEMMDQTFADRRRLIVKDEANVLKVKETYPCLFDENEVQFFAVVL